MAEGEANENKFSIRKVLVNPSKAVGVDENLANRLPILPHGPNKYSPMPYVFRVPAAGIPMKVVHLMAKSPPLHLLLDHTISVIWLLFAKSNYDAPLGINQLQWALAFLKTIQTRSGDYPEDINICINAIEEILVKGYADLQNEIKEASRLDESVIYGGPALNSSNLVTKDIPFSLNYSEMLNRSSLVQNAMPAFSMTSLECEEELEKIKEAAGVKSIEALDSKSKDKAINVLKMWKTDQVEKIRGELKRLRSIEDKMKDLDQHYAEDDPEEFFKCEEY